MRPELFRIPGLGIPIHSYGLLIVIGFLLAIYLAHKEARRRKLPDFVYDFGFLMLLSGIIGGRLWYFIEFYDQDFRGKPITKFLELWNGGLVFYGGAIGGFLGGALYLKWKKLPVAECLDVVAPFVPIGMAFGRLGCFMNGCCFGKTCSADFPLSIIFPKINNPHAPSPYSPVFTGQIASGVILDGDPAPLPVYPTQLLEAGYDFLVVGLLYWLLRGNVRKGVGFPLLVIVYSIGRFSLEFLRGDPVQGLLGLRIAQSFSLMLILLAGFILFLLYRKDFSRKASKVGGFF